MGKQLEFGISMNSTWPSYGGQALRLVQLADRLGYDLIGIQDHPYQWRFHDTWTLIAWLAAQTTRIRFFPDVANLPLRPPAMLAKAAASLDVLTGGRIELGLGAGFFWDAVAAMGGPGEPRPRPTAKLSLGRLHGRAIRFNVPIPRRRTGLTSTRPSQLR